MKLFLHFTYLFVSCLSFAQSESLDYVFDSKVYNEERTVSVFLPESYNSDDSTKEFHVAYLFDGQFQPYFSMVSSIMSYYEQTNEGIPLIVVGIHTKKRWGEFVPVCADQETDNVVGADELSFLKDEVIPLIESKYRTTRFKIGIGHSLGGTYVVNEIIKDNSIFNAVIAVSPNLTVCNEQIINNAQDYFLSDPTNRKFIYTTAGTVGEMELSFKKSLVRLDSLCTTMVFKNMYWNCDILASCNHMTTFVPSFNAGYLALSKKLVLMDSDLLAMSNDTTSTIVDQLSDFYDELSQLSQSQQQLNIDRILSHAKTLSGYGKFRACVELCQYANTMLESEGLSEDEKKEVSDMISKRLIRAEFNAIAQEAKSVAMMGDYNNASSLYIKAFGMNLLRGTHFVRMDAVPIFAQAGKFEEAFEQLDLLANKFQLGGNDAFVDDPLCTPLQKDERWKTLMDKFAKNGGLYR